MTSTADVSLDVFDQLSKGDAAPAWLTDLVVQAWGFTAHEVEVTLITVSENATFLVRVDGEPYAVTRVARPGYMAGTDAFESEVAWVAALSADGVVPVPQALPTLNGTYTATTGPWTCVSYKFVPGQILEDVSEPVPHYREIGRMTARLHEHTMGWQEPRGFTRHSWQIADMIGPAARWGRWEGAGQDDRLLRRAQEAALAVIADAPRGPGAWGLIHADLRPSNIMVDDGGLTVIDFDDCGYSWYLYDFAAALSFIEHVPEAPEMASEWVEGYSEIRPLTRGDLETGCALSMIRRLQMFGWTTTHRSDALPPELWDAQGSGTTEVAERYLRSATWLLE
ncbi:phosphotransferase [Actinotalea sp. M2MS4P-6]|uniref:phosphotransferase enzyme family protein n=1 Tax=Actinotalea sp. M2MS4P-6 TaxID=2983762 RepID=UPI0021E3CA31|nr:phosphotransferase [Actinotalea sp. M2MS4P-6]MCV2392946.1 phosphotransferase [Actinotalea sp. M2MS4P-6]